MTDEQRQRIHDITYSTEDRMELAERIVRLEEEIDKQKFKFEVLKAHGIEIVDAVGGGHEIYDTRQREVDRLEYENAKLRELVAHLMYVKPNDVNAIFHKGKLLRFDDLLAEVGMRWESEVD